MRVIFYILVIFSTSLFGQEKTYQVQYINNFQEFDSIPFTNDFVNHVTAEPSQFSTQVKLAWDSTFLFLQFHATDSLIETNHTHHDDQVYTSDDCLEMFLDFNGDGMNYIELGINPNGVYYDYKIVCPVSICGSWTSDSRFALDSLHITTEIQPRDSSGIIRYQVNVQIPFLSFSSFSKYGYSFPELGTIWRANFFNINPTNSSYNAWSPTGSFGFHQPDFFGKLIFKK